ncbi:MBL fold metallo-hydrolase [Bacteriovoracaceae bacterium]|nr:MBL fold metallo-hydrolase [Bacteriovoracaceae bacterium]
MKKIQFLHPSTFKLDGGAMFGIIPKPLWEKKIPADEKNRIHMSLRVPYIETQERKILIDTGIGFSNPEKFEKIFAIQHNYESFEYMLNKECGISCSDITDIILTHLHFDHVGGLCQNIDEVQIKNLEQERKKTPASSFSQARIHTHRQHFEYAQNPSQRDSGSFHSHLFLPLLKSKQKQGLLNLVEGDSGLILTDDDLKINYKTSQGHTPFMIHPIIDQEWIYMADLIPTHAHLPIPWVMGYDISPAITCEYKEKFLRYALENKLQLIYEHDIEYIGAKMDESKESWTTLQESSDI